MLGTGLNVTRGCGSEAYQMIARQRSDRTPGTGLPNRSQEPNATELLQIEGCIALRMYLHPPVSGGEPCGVFPVP